MATSKLSTEITAPPQTVYTLISDPTRLRDWDVTYESATPITLNHQGEPTFRADRTWANRGLHLTCLVTVSTPSRAFAFTCEGDDGEAVRESFVLAPAGATGTTITRELDIELPGHDLGVVAETTFASAWTDRLVEQAFAHLASLVGRVPDRPAAAAGDEAESRSEDSGSISDTERYSAHAGPGDVPQRPT